jgi:transcriptional regulator with XRE-family HTH domain
MSKEEEGPRTENIGLRIQMIRGKMTQQEFAKKLNIKQCYISRYEKGRVPKPDVLLKIARFANVSIEWLLTGEESAHRNGQPDGYSPEELRIITPTDKRIISNLSRLTEDDKKILLKIIKKMLKY